MSRRTRPGGGFEKEFLSEAENLLEEASSCAEALEDDGDDPNPARLNALFRAVHSMKGVAAMVGYGGIAEAAHDLEALLDDLRMGRVASSPSVRRGVRDGVAALAALVERVAAGEESPALASPLRTRFDAAVAVPSARSSPPAASLPPELEGSLSDYERHRVSEAIRRGKALAAVDLDLAFDDFDRALRDAMGAASADGELIGTFPGTASDPSRMAFRLLVALPAGADTESLGRRCGASALSVLSPAATPAAPVPAPEPPAMVS